MEYTFKFSIVVAVYNAEKYIKATIESVINQSIGFEENVELILVDDGSTDSSKNICKEFSKKYARNIKYFYKTNGGVSSARNLGIKNANGKYYNFLDSDDLLDKNALEVVYEFFEKNKYEIDMVTLPIECFEKQEGLYHRYLKYGNKSHIVNLEEHPQEYIFSCAASFYKRAIFKKFIFNTNLHLAEDLYFNTKIYLNNPKFGIISPTESVYFYRKRFTENSVTNRNEYADDWLVNVLDLVYKYIIKDAKKGQNELPTFIQNILIYNIVKRLDMAHFVGKEILNKFFKIAERILSNVSEEVIMLYECNDYFYRAMLLMIKYKEYDIKKSIYIDSQNNICIKGIVLQNIENYSLKICSIKIEENKLYIETFFNDIMPPDFKVYYKYENELFSVKTNEINNSFLQKRFFDIILGKSYSVLICIPLSKKGTHNLILKANNSEIPITLKNAYNNEALLYEKDIIKENIKIKIDNNIIQID